MTNSRFARQPYAGFMTSGWVTLRVAVLMRVSDSGASLSGTPRFAVGLCSGNTNIMGDSTVDHFVGLLSTDDNWSRSVGPVRYITVPSITAVKKVGTTITAGASFGAFGATFHTTTPFMIFVDITKGSPNFSFTVFICTGITAPGVTEANFLTTSLAPSPSFAEHASAGPVTVAVDEVTDGTLDHACVAWDQTLATVDIHAWRVLKLA